MLEIGIILFAMLNYSIFLAFLMNFYDEEKSMYLIFIGTLFLFVLSMSYGYIIVYLIGILLGLDSHIKIKEQLK